jgi:carbon storage regulator
MLVLSRKAGQTIVVANNISIAVLGVRRGAVRLGIEAPREVRVCREELLGGPDRRAATRVAGKANLPDGSAPVVEPAAPRRAPTET